MQVTSGSLVIVGANTEKPQVFWNGLPVSAVVAVKVNFNGKIALKVKKENLQEVTISAILEAGIKVKGV